MTTNFSLNRAQFSPPNTKTQSGFTLIEIIVVVAIISVMVSVLGVRMSRDSNRLAKLESKRFHVIVNEVRDEAVLLGENFLLNVDESGNYFFSRVSEPNIVSYDGLFKQRKVENGVKISFDVFNDLNEEIAKEEDEVSEQESEDKDAPEIDNTKKILISTLGEITPFEINFSGNEDTFTVFIDDKNRLARREGRTGIF